MKIEYVFSQICKLKEEIMREAHSTPYTAHSGSSKIYRDLWHNFWWDKMKRDIAEFVQHCQVCQQVKAGHIKPPGLLMPLQISE